MKAAAIQIKDKTHIKEEIKVTPFRKEIRKTTPHKHNSYFEIIYLSAGKGFHGIDNFNYPVKPPIVFLVRKDQLHHFDLQEEADGFVAIIKKEFLTNCLDAELQNMISRLSAFQCLGMKDNASLNQLFDILVKELAGRINRNTALIEGLLKAIIALMLEVAQPLAPNQFQKPDLYQQLLLELQSGNSIRNSVQYYASLLNTSPQNLNAACRKAVDQSAAVIISESIIAEAKRLLMYTNNTVAEIGFKLNFSDASNFVKYFKRIVGTTPETYRNSR
jgi:AraC-like DNA-binding protein